MNGQEKDSPPRLPSIVTPGELKLPSIPVVDGEGREIVRPDVIQAITQLASLGQLSRIRRSLEKEEFQGRLDPRTLDATDKQVCLDLRKEWYYSPWVAAFFINDGPNTAYIAINDPFGWLELKADETRSIDRTKADQRIGRLYYKCAPGETASIRVEGVY